MENLSGISGYVASTLVLLTFVAKDMRLLRATAIFSNVAFITYGAIEWVPPVLLLHLVLLPLNIVRFSEAISADRITDNPIPDRANRGESLHPAALSST
jgi:CRP/FNR family transcriptional regulator, cyclic AMP receptor protein